jgi:hypothetical protein
MKPEQSATFGQQSHMGKASEVAEIATSSYVFLAFQDVSLYIGQCLYRNSNSSHAHVFVVN